MVEFIKHIIEKILLKEWDWLAFIIAVISFIVAYKTFLSQRKTADNTTPAINKDIQKFLLQKMFVYLLDAYTNIVVHERLINDKSVILNTTEEITVNQKIPENMIHSELYYGQQPTLKKFNKKKYQKESEKYQKTQKKFQKLNTLEESIKYYNENLFILRGIIHDNIFKSHHIIFDRLERLRYKCQIIIMQWKMAMIELYEDDNIIESVVKDLFIKEAIDDDESYLVDRYGFGDKLISFLLIKDKKLYDTLVIFMNQRAEIYEKEYRKYLLNDYERN